jgi:ATP-binding cassette, subfamily B, heavy metal transporter
MHSVTPATTKNETAARNEPPIGATLRRFLPYLWPDNALPLKLRILAAGVLVIAAKAALLSMGFTYRAIIDRMTLGANADGNLGESIHFSTATQPGVIIVIGLVLAYGGGRFTGVLFNNLRNVVFERVGQDATRDLAVNVFKHLHALSLRFHLGRHTGEVTKVIDRGTKSIDTMLYFLLFNIVPTVAELIFVLIIFGTEFSLWLSAVTAVMVIIYIAVTRKITDWRNALRMEMNDLDTLTVSRSVDSLLNYETVKYFSAEEREIARYENVAARYAKAAIKSENSLAWLNVAQSLVTNLMLAGAMVYTVWGWSRGQYTIGDVVLVNTLLVQLFQPLDMLGMVYRMIRQGLIDMQSMFALIDTPAEITDVPNAPDLMVSNGSVEFDNVSFGYEPDRQILDRLSFCVPAGKTLAIVGPSGAGKSTIARLLFRFYDPQSGAIRIDGQQVNCVTQASLRAAIGIVPQDTVLFNDDIGYNIAYGRSGASEADVIAAAAGAAIDGFIQSLPQGYRTPVGERGLKLSGGEKQRVAIARTLLKNPPILILDEATSALDSRTEEAIQDTLNAIAEKRTTIIIAHRLSTITGADNIIVLDKGKVVEQGNHRRLLAQGGLYAGLWARQQAEREDSVLV